MFLAYFQFYSTFHPSPLTVWLLAFILIMIVVWFLLFVSPLLALAFCLELEVTNQPVTLTLCAIIIVLILAGDL